MREIAVVHMDLMSKGGGEAVAMCVLEALQDVYDVTLLTLAEPDFDELNDYYNTSVTDVEVELAGRVTPWIHERYGIKYYILQNALLGRYARSRADDFDLLVSTINELGLTENAVQYIHFPFDWTVSLNNREHIFHPTVEEDGLYERLCTRLGRVDLSDLRENVLLANSGWTADVVADAYGTRPRVLYPPIDTSQFDPLPWDERENGVVTLGRIERSKRLDELIAVVDGVRDRGHDVHLHVVGPTVDEEYYDEVAELAASRPYVELEGEVSRSELVRRVCTHRYGIHGKQYEHFGMAVAELVAAGAVTFVPATGGQHEIVRDRPELLYESVDDAVEGFDRVLSNPSLARELRSTRGEIRRRFGRDRFESTVRDIVAERIEPASSRAVTRPAEVQQSGAVGGND